MNSTIFSSTSANSAVQTPEVFDDFSSYAPGQSITTGTTLPTGQTYTFYPAGGSVAPTISNGRLIGIEGTTYYLGVVLNGPVQQIGANVVYYPGTGTDGYTIGAILICPSTVDIPGVSLTSLIHLTFSRLGAAVAVATSGGTGGLVTIATLTLPDTILPLNSVETGPIVYPMNVIIYGNTLQMTYGGGSVTVTDSRIGTVNGKYVFWEQFSAAAQLDLIAYSTFWANANPLASSKVSLAVQQWSPFLDLLANGALRAPLPSTVGPYKAGYANLGALDVRGDIVASGNDGNGNIVPARLKAFVGGVTGGQAHAAPVTIGASIGPFGSGGTSNQLIFNPTVSNGTLPFVGSLFRYIYRGRFASNANNKRLLITALGNTVVDTGAVAFNGGEWTLTLELWRDSANNTQFQGWMFTNSNVIVSSETYAGSYNQGGVPGSWSVALSCDTSAANDIIFYGQWGEYEDNQ